jgi:hypothetical protein
MSMRASIIISQRHKVIEVSLVDDNPDAMRIAAIGLMLE